MLIKPKCEHCGNVFETDGMNRTEFCPHCGKETSILARVAVPELGVPQSHRLWARIMRPLILFILLPVAIVGVICYGVRQSQIAKAAQDAERWKEQHTLNSWEETAVIEKMKNAAQDTRLKIQAMNESSSDTTNTNAK
jgi:DNA-directed RNA polymerase subunit RPC12/RpoP